MARFDFVDEPDTLVPELCRHQQLAVDTEFMRERTYYAQLCLTQIASPDEIWCVDVLSGHDQDAFWTELLRHDWVLHSARQDIEVVYQTAGAMPASIFDTQVAAALIGMPPQIGYAGLVRKLFDVEIHKVHTRADWSKRPLRNEYLEYAAEDVEYLLPMYEALVERLRDRDRLEWAREDSAWLLDPDLYVVGAGQAIDRLKGARNFRGRKRAAAARLAAWRETEAVRKNRPRQWIMRDKVLLDLAWHLPQSERELANIEGVPPKVAKRVGHHLLGAIAESARDDRDYQPPRPPNEDQKKLLKEMQAKIAVHAAELGIAAETLASKRELAAIIVAENHEARLFKGWRAELVGEEIRNLLS